MQWRNEGSRESFILALKDVLTRTRNGVTNDQYYDPGSIKPWLKLAEGLNPDSEEAAIIREICTLIVLAGGR